MAETPGTDFSRQVLFQGRNKGLTQAMVPKIHVRFRKRMGVPYAIEQFSGKQFRCRHCNTVFFTERELDAHVRSTLSKKPGARLKLSPAVPQLSGTC